MEDERSNSFWLYKNLETIGVSEKIRRKYQKAGINLEILLTIGRRGEITCYNFGSSCEGTTTPGMESDLDLVLCKESCPVIEYLQPEYKEGWVSLMVTDPETAVGYVKLQLVKDGFPLTSNDWEKVPSNQQNLVQSDIRGRLVWRNSQKIPPDESPVLTCRNGPAETVETTIIISTDNVPAYRCRSWPSLANEWIGRVRHYKWPGKTVIGRFKNFGCFLVGVGHPNSKERELEWRISFSHQERELMFELNDVQYKCYTS